MEDDFLKQFDKRKNPHKVPEGYFGRKKVELLAIADDEQKAEPRLFKLQTTLGWVAGIAAALLLGVFLYPSPPTNTTTPTIETRLTNASIEDYLIEEYPSSPVEEALIINELTAADLEAISFNTFEESELEEFIDNNFDQTLDYEYL